MISPNSILLIRLARLGDVILTEPAVRLCRELFPTAHLSYLTGHRCAPIPRMMPQIEEVISLDRVALRDGNKLTSMGKILQLAAEIRRRHFDLVIDLMGFRESELLALWSGAPSRLGFKRYRKPYWGFCFNLPPVEEDKSLLVAEMFRKVVGSLQPSPSPPQPSPVAPQLTTPSESEALAESFWRQEGLHGTEAVYGFQISASDPVRTWPLEKFIELARRIYQEAHARRRPIGIVSFAAARESRECETVTQALRDSGIHAVSAIGPPDREQAIPQMASLMKRCSAVVSNDTGPMHLSAAVGTPTLGLFSIGVTEHYRPLGPRCSFIKRNPLSDLTSDEVFAQLRRMLARGPDLLA
jgi:ADP-heptose:LPS heptosyltransferase